MTYFRLTIRLLDCQSHGRDDHGQPEWPPSPLRAFQALVCAAAARWNERAELKTAAPALRWLERLPPPLILASPGRQASTPYRMYVPDNVGDKVASSWKRGGDISIADFRSEKDVLPVKLEGHDPQVTYLWPLPDPGASDAPTDTLVAAARSITHLGWGVDMVAAEAALTDEKDLPRLPGEAWQPTAHAGGTRLRVPVPGTLDDLLTRHAAFLERIQPDNLFKPVPPLSAFAIMGYARARETAGPAYAAFSILRLNGSGYRPFCTARNGLAVSAMVRHAAAKRARSLGWDESKIATFVLGHGEAQGQAHEPVDGPRLAFLPLPSVESRSGESPVISMIRRVLVAVVGGGADSDLANLSRLLTGADLVRERDTDATAMLSRIPDRDTVVSRYTKRASTWATVTPVILPGYDDPGKLRQRLPRGTDAQALDADEQRRILKKLGERIDYLLRKAIRQAGLGHELATHAQIEWNSVGFWRGLEHATAYQFPNKLRRHRRLHVQITWRDASGDPIAIPGPICLGGGRFHGIGLFAGVEGRNG